MKYFLTLQQLRITISSIIGLICKNIDDPKQIIVVQILSTRIKPERDTD